MIIVQYINYQINMLHNLNFHNVICHIYLIKIKIHQYLEKLTGTETKLRTPLFNESSLDISNNKE